MPRETPEEHSRQIYLTSGSCSFSCGKRICISWSWIIRACTVQEALQNRSGFWTEIPTLSSEMNSTLVHNAMFLVTPKDEYRMINPPAWTLSFEFIGSLILILICTVHEYRIRSALAVLVAVVTFQAGYPYYFLGLFFLAVVFRELESEHKIVPKGRSLWGIIDYCISNVLC